MDRLFAHRALVASFVAFSLLLIVLPACSDDPVLGPSDGSEESGGSYSSINRLAPPTAADSSQSRPSVEQDSAAVNPERF